MLLKHNLDSLRLPTGIIPPGTAIEFTDSASGHERGEQYWFSGEVDGTHAKFHGYNARTSYSERFTPSQLHQWLKSDTVRILGDRVPPFPGAREDTPLPVRCRFKDMKAEVLQAQIDKGELTEQAAQILSSDDRERSETTTAD